MLKTRTIYYGHSKDSFKKTVSIILTSRKINLFWLLCSCLYSLKGRIMQYRTISIFNFFETLTRLRQQKHGCWLINRVISWQGFDLGDVKFETAWLNSLVLSSEVQNTIQMNIAKNKNFQAPHQKTESSGRAHRYKIMRKHWGFIYQFKFLQSTILLWSVT